MADLAVVWRLLDDLRRHPERRADERALLVHRVGELTGDAKVSKLHVPALRQQHVRS